MAFDDYAYSLKNYMKDASFVAKNGTYVPELHAYVKLAGGKGEAKMAFVGVDRSTNQITTFHLKEARQLEKKAPSLGLITKKTHFDLIGPNRESGWRYPYK